MIKYNENYVLYVLALEEGKFYVGITKEFARRYAEHKMGKGAAFTRKYHPITVVYKKNVKSKYKNKAESFENSLTIALMKKYGVDNVRGGDYCQLSTEEVLKSMKSDLRESILNAYGKKEYLSSYKNIDKMLIKPKINNTPHQMLIKFMKN